MATSVDTNVLSYLLLASDETAADAAERALDQALADGRILVCGPVFAELLATRVWGPADLERHLSEMGIDLDLTFDGTVWSAAAAPFARYLEARRPAKYRCPTCGTSQRFTCRDCGRDLSRPKHILADFLIGAHALRHGYELLTADTGLYAGYFPEVRLRAL